MSKIYTFIVVFLAVIASSFGFIAYVGISAVNGVTGAVMNHRYEQSVNVEVDTEETVESTTLDSDKASKAQEEMQSEYFGN